MPVLSERQLELFTNYVSRTVQNNQEIHPSDMPQVMTMLQLLAERGVWVSEEQIEHVCNSLHSSGNQEAETSEALRDYLRHTASAFEFIVRHRERGDQMYKRPYHLIADDIVDERDVAYSQTT